MVSNSSSAYCKMQVLPFQEFTWDLGWADVSLNFFSSYVDWF